MLIMMMMRKNLLNNSIIWLPYVDLFISYQFASLQNDLLGRIVLIHVSPSSITSWICGDFLLYMFGKLQILIYFTTVLHSCLICLILEQFLDRNCIFCGNYITKFCRTETSLVLPTESPIAFSHLLVKIICLVEVASKEREADFMIFLSVRSTHCWLKFALLILDHLLAPLGLHDNCVSHLLEFFSPRWVLTICHGSQCLTSYIVKILVCIFKISTRLILLSNTQLLSQGVMSLNHIYIISL